MRIKNTLCTILITSDALFPSGDNNSTGKYDIIYNPHGYKETDYFNVFSISISLKDRGYSIALIGDGNSYDTDCAVLDDTTLTVLQGWDVIQFNIESAQIVKRSALDSMGCNFGIFALNGGYLIYGETDITMLNHDLRRMWSFSGYDIFVSITNKPAFEIKADRICLYDFYDNYYEIDFDGKVIVGPDRYAKTKP